MLNGNVMKPVLFESYKVCNNKFISVIKLNSPGNLNALTLEMVDLIQEHLDSVRYSENIVAVILDSVIDKAFCAGGDVVSITQAWSKGDEQLAKDFFLREYKLDRDIHRFPKPVICLANGIVMGGGMGLMNGCSHRVVTETTYMAMPEISIGLFPDVGGSWFLNQIPDGMGLFLGLTAAPMNGADAKYLGLADYMISSHYRNEIVEHLIAADWNAPAQEIVDKLFSELQTASAEQCSHVQSNCEQHQALIATATHQETLPEVVAAILNCDSDERWLRKAKDNLDYGSPLSAWLIHQQLQRSASMSLEEVFEFEYNLVLACCKQGDFAEGVRALLIDKDRQPNWQYRSVDEVNHRFINTFFE